MGAVTESGQSQLVARGCLPWRIWTGMCLLSTLIIVFLFVLASTYLLCFFVLLLVLDSLTYHAKLKLIFVYVVIIDVVTKIKHVINGHEVTFQDDTRLLNELPADSRQRSPFHGQTHSLGRGRGLLRMTNPSVTSIGIQDGGQTTSQTSQDRSPDGRSLTLFGDPTSAPSPGQFYSCGSIPHSVSPQKLEAAATSGPQVFGTSQGTGVPLHRFPLSINSANADQPYRSGTSGSRVFPSSQGTDGPLHKSPLSSNWAYTDPLMSYHPTEFRSSSPYRRPEMLAPQSPEKEVPTEGLNVIQIKGLPEHATPEDLKALLWESLSTNRTTKVNLEIARWAPEDTRVYFEDVKGRHAYAVSDDTRAV